MVRKLSQVQSQEAHLPLSGFLKLYSAQLRAERKSPRTIQMYLYVLEKFSRWFAEGEGRPPTLADYTSINVRLFLGETAARTRYAGHPWLDGKGKTLIAGATIHQYTRTSKTFAAWLEREGYTKVNVLASVRLPKVEQKQLIPLTEEEEKLLIGTYNDNVPTDCRIKAIFLLMLDTGLRMSEITGLKEADLDIDNGFLLVMGKGRKERSVPFGFTTERVLRKYLNFFRPEPAIPSVEELFLSPDGYPMTNLALKMIFVRARNRTGIKRLHAHLLRHTYGIRAQEGGMPTITLQHYMGHSTSKITERYAHAAQSERLKRARGYSPVDQLRVRLNRSAPVRPRKRR